MPDKPLVNSQPNPPVRPSNPGRISGATIIAGVVGNPVRHSKSPTIHNAAFQAAGLDWAYGAFEVPVAEGARIVESMRTLGLGGLSVTMPFKQAVAQSADRVTPAVERLGVANTLFWDGDSVVADSTDGDGFVDSYRARFGAELTDRSVAIVGAGGAARSLIEALGRVKAAEILIVNRTAEAAEAAAALVLSARVVDPADIERCDVVVNATSVGMTGGPAPGVSPVPAEVFGDHQHVVDIVYQPAVTELMTVASERGAEVDNGLGMLIHQAARQFERWTAQPPSIAAMTEAVGHQYDRRS